MDQRRLKYIFFISSAILLFMMLLTSRDAGITCDEVLHYDHSVSVYNYYKTHGADKSALNTPVTNLKYYGQSYDNLVTLLIKWFKIDDVYRFRHIMSPVAGWLVILITGLFAVWLAGYRAGLFVLFLFALSPTFIGHSQNNLKDIPFALGYIAGTFSILKFLESGKKTSISAIIFLTVSIALAISVRAGGILLICYLFFFFLIFYLFRYLEDKQIDLTEIRSKILWMTGITIVSWLAGVIFWPYALQNPLTKVIESYHVMAHFPDTFRQIFEGKVEWSDFMPWYYLPESMAITIPLIVLAGLVIFFLISKFIIKQGKTLLYGFVVFTVLFPLSFVIIEKSNLYSSWRQFLFVYPGIIVLAATGFHYLFELIKTRYIKWIAASILIVLSVHPLRFMIANHPYYYLYYNQLVGGLKGAYGNYETDYYFVSQTQASEWLINYLKEKHNEAPVKVKATYSVKWQFRKHPEIETSFLRYEERSQSDWDYAIVTSRYITPFQLKNKIWPPENSIYIIYADKIPVCAVLERKSKDDFNGYVALNEGRNKEAIHLFEKVLKVDDKDEMIFYNFAAALFNDMQYQKADSVLKMGLEINPDFEPILMYLGNIAKSQNKTDEAIMYYKRVIQANRKYYEAYVVLSKLLSDRDISMARDLLRTCLTMSPRYKPAIIAMADTYRKSDPDVAKKYDDFANTIK
jgi:tetratricopeptide (TPR) repeat protein